MVPDALFGIHVLLHDVLDFSTGWAASDGGPAKANEEEETGKCQQLDVAYF